VGLSRFGSYRVGEIVKAAYGLQDLLTPYVHRIPPGIYFVDAGLELGKGGMHFGNLARRILGSFEILITRNFSKNRVAASSQNY
jgi:hypothetical protein